MIEEIRSFHSGMGQAVAERTILRKKDGRWETWQDVAIRVAAGNALLAKTEQEQKEEFDILSGCLKKAATVMSGRHLQHGDETQPDRNMEVFVNCFEKNEKLLTLEYGPTTFGSIVGKSVHVKAKDGVWRQVIVKCHGKQIVSRYYFGATNGNTDQFNLQVIATPNHRWFLDDETITTDLSVGDILMPAPFIEEKDEEAVRHGLIFGDGSANKTHKRKDYLIKHVSQGRSYCSIRLCGADKKYLDLFESYSVSYPPSCNGDPVVYIGKKEFWKELPFCNDPEYINGFIHGWWLADGSKTYTHNKSNFGIEISTSDKQNVDWLLDYASYAGYVVTGMSERERKEGDGSFENGKSLFSIRLAKGIRRKVLKIEEVGETDVYCVEEPVTSGFVLANGLLTGNCATAASSFAVFYLLMNGSGVGRCYDDDLMLVNWDHAPNLRCVLSETHPDFDFSAHESVRDARHKYAVGKDVMWHVVEDSREGWAKALEIWENSAFQKIHSDKLLILDFSKIRSKGTPIKGMQNRPASGPVPLMNAFAKAATLKGARLPKWMQCMYVDHYFAECVLVGGARRAARMSVKSWRDETVLDFITIKRPIEFYDKSAEEIAAIRAGSVNPPQGFLWSSNNSILTDKEFWRLVSLPKNHQDYGSDLCKHARKVFKAASEASYADGTGEPGFINQDKLTKNDEGIEKLVKENHYFGSKKYQIEEDSEIYMSRLLKKATKKANYMIVNPCSEIAIAIWGAFCTIADLVPFFCDSLDEFELTARAVTRSLIRVNTMDSIYSKEVQRTNRIGVGLTGIHEFAWKFFKFTFRDLLDEEKSKPFWMALSRIKRAIRDESIKYSKKLGVSVPHTDTTIKPSGTVSKLFGLTEGWHLPTMLYYLRWVQFSKTDPLVQQYRNAGYPTQELKQYKDTIIVGFPTTPIICELGLSEIVTAAQATPEEQYKWLMLGEKYWIRGVDENGTELVEDTGNQISYTLKYNPDVVSHTDYVKTLKEYQSQVKCCSVMPQERVSSYEYLPEQPVTKAEYENIYRQIQNKMAEDVDKTHILCDSGACPVDFKEKVKIA